MKTGLLRTNLGFNIVYDWYIPGQPNITDPAIPIKSFFNYSYLTIPLSVGYKFHLLKHLYIIPQVGAQYLISTDISEYSIFGDGSRKPVALDTDGIGNNHFQISVLISFEIILNDRWFVNIEPFVDRSLLKQGSPYFETTYYSFGGSVGISRRFSIYK